jgi:signal transduction histidine kinase
VRRRFAELGARRLARRCLAATTVLAVLGVGLVVAWSHLPADWRLSLVVGGVLLGATAAVGFPLAIRAHDDLRAARRLLATATEQMREAYAQLLATNEELRHTAAARDQALTELHATIRQRESFLDAIAHDLKTPLTVIKGHADLLSGSARRDLGPERPAVARSLGRITENAERMRLLIDELLTLAHLEADVPVALDRHPTDLVEVTRAAIATAALTTQRHQIVLDAEAMPVVGDWDRSRLERMVANLLANAIKYSPAGGRISVRVGRPEGRSVAELSVADQGIGIPAEDLESVFARFHRGQNVPLGVPGTGLGLASVRQIAELHGGTVDVQSHEGTGSRFTVRLPIASSADARTAGGGD